MKKWLFPKWKQPLRTELLFRVIRHASYKSDFDKLMEATAEYKA
jgi:hypothetical protein